MWRYSVCTLGRLPSEIPWSLSDLVHLIALEKVHPLPETRNEYMQAQTMALISKALGVKKPKTTDYMLSAQMDEQRSRDLSFEDQIRRAFTLAGIKKEAK